MTKWDLVKWMEFGKVTSCSSFRFQFSLYDAEREENEIYERRISEKKGKDLRKGEHFIEKGIW
jgi:hypothetical protein